MRGHHRAPRRRSPLLRAPGAHLFHEIKPHFPMHAQPRVWRVVQGYVDCALDVLERMPQNGFDVHGQPLQCRATTRRGTPCQRMPLHHNGYCPSHQHLAETEEIELVAWASGRAARRVARDAP